MRYLSFCQEFLNDFFIEQRIFRHQVHFLKVYILTLNPLLSPSIMLKLLPILSQDTSSPCLKAKTKLWRAWKAICKTHFPFFSSETLGMLWSYSCLSLREEIGLNEMKPNQITQIHIFIICIIFFFPGSHERCSFLILQKCLSWGVDNASLNCSKESMTCNCSDSSAAIFKFVFLLRKLYTME